VVVKPAGGARRSAADRMRSRLAARQRADAAQAAAQAEADAIADAETSGSDGSEAVCLWLELHPALVWCSGMEGRGELIRARLLCQEDEAGDGEGGQGAAGGKKGKKAARKAKREAERAAREAREGKTSAYDERRRRKESEREDRERAQVGVVMTSIITQLLWGKLSVDDSLDWVQLMLLVCLSIYPCQRLLSIIVYAYIPMTTC